MKRQVMLMAWSVAEKFATFAEALKYAWSVVKLRFSMLLGNVNFKYRKVDGSIREAVGTLAKVPETKGGSAAKGVFVYFDVVAGGWRSAKVENLIF